MNEWVPDILGAGYEQKTLNLGDDQEGKVVATLVRKLPPEKNLFQKLIAQKKPFSDFSVLYVHGWSDYFFQTELAEFWNDVGADFYALDLRKYGRSLRDYQTPGYITDLNIYEEELNKAVYEISSGSKKQIVLLGHSTGGLVLSLWAAKNESKFSYMILNSPWLEFQLTDVARKLMQPILTVSAKLAPVDPVPQLDFGYYTKAQHEVATASHPLKVNEEWRPKNSMPVRPGWLHAVFDAQQQLSKGLEINKPVCVMLSKRSLFPTSWSEDLKYADSVLNVDEVAKAALHLGSNVTILRIEDALHDIFLSKPDARSRGYESMRLWLDGVHRALKR